MAVRGSVIVLDLYIFKDYFNFKVENDWKESGVGEGDQSGSCCLNSGRK